MSGAAGGQAGVIKGVIMALSKRPQNNNDDDDDLHFEDDRLPHNTHAFVRIRLV